jgi:hypothetical protein
MNPITVLQKALDGVKGLTDVKAAVDGIRDELLNIFTDEEITVANSLVRGLEECEPLSDHVDELSLSVMRRAIDKSDYKLAKNAIRSGVKQGAKRICIELLVSAAVTACGKCPDILLDALPQATAKRYWGF